MPLNDDPFGFADPAALDAAVADLTHDSAGWQTSAGPDGPCEWSTCVSVNRVPGAGAAVRRTINGKPVGPIQKYTDPEWKTFIQSVKDGQFD